MSEIKKIVIHYENGKPPLVLKKGLVAYFENQDQDLFAEFLNVSDADIPLVLKSLSLSLKMALSSVQK